MSSSTPRARKVSSIPSGRWFANSINLSTGTNTSSTPAALISSAAISAPLKGSRDTSLLLDFISCRLSIAALVCLAFARVSVVTLVAVPTPPPKKAPAAKASIICLVSSSTSTSVSVAEAAAVSLIASCTASVTPSSVNPLAPSLADLAMILVAVSFNAVSAASCPKALTRALPALPGNALSKTPINAPAPNATPGASVVGLLSLMACCVSPTPRMKEGMNTPKVPPTKVPIGPATKVPAAAPVRPPASEGAISGICSPAVCFIQLKKSPAVSILRNSCLPGPVISAKFASAPASPNSSSVSIPVASPTASTKRQFRDCSRSTPLAKLAVNVSCLAALSIPTKLGTSSDPKIGTRSSVVRNLFVTGAVSGTF